MEDTTKVTNTISKPPRCVIHAELDGFPLTITFRGKAESFKNTVQRLREIGATPPSLPALATATATAATATESGPPKCPTHGTKMKESRKPGVWYCTKKVGEDSYCKEEVKR